MGIKQLGPYTTTIYSSAMTLLLPGVMRVQDDLDAEIETFSLIIHNILTGNFKEIKDEPIDQEDTKFIDSQPAFKIGRFLGRGQAGSVYLGEDHSGSGLFAIKIIYLPLAVGVGLPRRTAFLAYQKVLKLIHHQFIVPYIGWSVKEDQANVFTEYCPDGSLHTFIQEKSLDERLTKKIIKDLVEGLIYIHSHGIVHRDLKPSNILRSGNTFRISDFGSARIQQPCCNNPHQKELSGTPNYSPPEAIRNECMYEHCGEDIWGLGCCLWEMVMGFAPWNELENKFAIYFTLGSLTKDSANNPLLDQIRSSVDDDCYTFLEACLSIDVYNRATSIALSSFRYLNVE